MWRSRRRSSADETSSYRLLHVPHRQEVLDGGRYGQSVDAGHDGDGKATANGVAAERLQRRRSSRGDSQGEKDVGIVDEVKDDTIAKKRAQHVNITVDDDQQVNHRYVVVDDGAVDWPLCAAAAAVDALIQRCTVLQQRQRPGNVIVEYTRHQRTALLGAKQVRIGAEL